MERRLVDNTGQKRLHAPRSTTYVTTYVPRGQAETGHGAVVVWAATIVEGCARRRFQTTVRRIFCSYQEVSRYVETAAKKREVCNKHHLFLRAFSTYLESRRPAAFRPPTNAIRWMELSSVGGQQEAKTASLFFWRCCGLGVECCVAMISLERTLQGYRIVSAMLSLPRSLDEGSSLAIVGLFGVGVSGTPCLWDSCCLEGTC